MDQGCSAPICVGTHSDSQLRAGGGAHSLCRMNFPVPVAAVVLDMDGTLLDTEAIYVGALIHAAASLGASIPDSLCHAVVGLPGAAVPDMLRSHFGDAFVFPALFKAYAAR